jgi:hypothetical protein
MLISMVATEGVDSLMYCCFLAEVGNHGHDCAFNG